MPEGCRQPRLTSLRGIAAKATRETQTEGHPVHKLTIRVLLASLVIGLVSPGGALAQGSSAPAGPPRHFERSFGVIDAPEQFDQVLQIVDFAAGSTWTPLHTPGGYVYSTVIDGAISTRVSTATGGAYEATYEAGETFVEKPGDYVQLGNASAGNTRIMATAVLPKARATDDLPGRFHQRRLSCPLGSGPETMYRSVIAVDRPEPAFELVQLVLVPAASPPPIVPEWAQIAALYGVPTEARESCHMAWGRVAAETQTVSHEYMSLVALYARNFERVLHNLCVSSAYVPLRVASDGLDLERAANLYRPAP